MHTHAGTHLAHLTQNDLHMHCNMCSTSADSKALADEMKRVTQQLEVVSVISDSSEKLCRKLERVLVAKSQQVVARCTCTRAHDVFECKRAHMRAGV